MDRKVVQAGFKFWMKEGTYHFMTEAAAVDEATGLVVLGEGMAQGWQN